MKPPSLLPPRLAAFSAPSALFFFFLAFRQDVVKFLFLGIQVCTALIDQLLGSIHFLFFPVDGLVRFAAALRQLSQDAALRHALGHGARSKVAREGLWPSKAAAMVDLYSDITADRIAAETIRPVRNRAPAPPSSPRSCPLPTGTSTSAAVASNITTGVLGLAEALALFCRLMRGENRVKAVVEVASTWGAADPSGRGRLAVFLDGRKQKAVDLVVTKGRVTPPPFVPGMQVGTPQSPQLVRGSTSRFSRSYACQRSRSLERISRRSPGVAARQRSTIFDSCRAASAAPGDGPELTPLRWLPPVVDKDAEEWQVNYTRADQDIPQHVVEGPTKQGGEKLQVAVDAHPSTPRSAWRN
mgnify:CR=1 FL=1